MFRVSNPVLDNVSRSFSISKAFSNVPRNSENEDIDKISRERKKEESFDIKFLAFVLVDIIPYKKKDNLISDFERLFSLPRTGVRLRSIKSQIRDITEGGVGGFKVRLGDVHNINRLSPNRSQPVSSGETFVYDNDGVKTELPDAIDRIEIWLGQDVDFCYYVFYFCYINKDYQRINRDTYIHSDDLVSFSDEFGVGDKPRGPDHDPTLATYENEVALFLSQFASGLYLEKYTSGKPVPSIRILSTPTINFSNLSEWGDKYSIFLEYMRISRYYHVYHRSIISLQTDRLFQKSFLSKGITLLYSEEILPNDKFSPDQLYDRIRGDSSVFTKAAMDYFVPLYWSNFYIYSTLADWKTKLKGKLSEISSDSITLKELENKVTEILNLHGQFAGFNTEEKVNIRTSRNAFNILKRLKGPPSFTVFLYEIELFKQISNLIETSLSNEKMLIDDIEKEINMLTSYYRDRSTLKVGFTNIDLQQQLKILTIIMGLSTLAVTAVATVISFFLNK